MTVRTAFSSRILLLLALSWSISSVVDVVEAQNGVCGEFSIAAPPSLEPLATAWINQYNNERCVDVSQSRVTATVEIGGSADSIARVCQTSSSGPVDVGGMTRLPFPGEATTENDWYYECERSTVNVIGVRLFQFP